MPAASLATPGQGVTRPVSKAQPGFPGGKETLMYDNAKIPVSIKTAVTRYIDIRDGLADFCSFLEDICSDIDDVIHEISDQTDILQETVAAYGDIFDHYRCLTGCLPAEAPHPVSAAQLDEEALPFPSSIAAEGPHEG